MLILNSVALFLPFPLYLRNHCVSEDLLDVEIMTQDDLGRRTGAEAIVTWKRNPSQTLKDGALPWRERHKTTKAIGSDSNGARPPERAVLHLLY